MVPGLLLDVTLITDLNHFLSDALAGFDDGKIQGFDRDGVADHEGESDTAGLNAKEDVEDEDCFFHWAGYRVDEVWR